MGVPLVIIHVRLGFSLINHPAIGVSPFMETPFELVESAQKLSYVFFSIWSAAHVGIMIQGPKSKLSSQQGDAP